MSLTSAVIRELVMAGLSGESLVAACERIEAAAIEPVKTRTANAERQARFRERNRNETVTRNVTDNAESVTNNVTSVTVTPSNADLSPIPPISNLNPLQKTPLKGVKKVSPDVTPKAKRSTRLPENYDCGSEGTLYAENLGLTLDEIIKELEKFCDYHAAKGTLMVDWDAGWRNWCRNAIQFKSRAGPFAEKSRQPSFFRT